MERFFFEATQISCFYLKFPPLILSLIKGFHLRQLCGILMVIVQFPSFFLHLFIGILLKGMIFPSIPFIYFTNLYEIHPLDYNQYHLFCCSNCSQFWILGALSSWSPIFFQFPLLFKRLFLLFGNTKCSVAGILIGNMCPRFIYQMSMLCIQSWQGRVVTVREAR